MKYGDLGKRIVAHIIDSILISAVCFLLGFVLGIAGVIISPLLVWLYSILMEGGSWHATLGKRVMGLYVANAQGMGISYSTAILRSLGKMLSTVTCGIGYLIGVFNNEKQCLHDMLAKTYVLEGQPHSYNGGHAKSGPCQELVGISGALAGTVYPISSQGLSIGRDTLSCQVVLPSSQSRVSRVHCYVTFNPMSGMFVLNDRNSTHGTFLANGKRVTFSQPVALRSGDRFYLATPENMFEVR